MGGSICIFQVEYSYAPLPGKTNASIRQSLINSSHQFNFFFLNRCDSGYKGPTCIPEFPLSSSIQSDFEESGLLQSDWLAVHGGDIVHDGNAACGVITSGASLYFSQVKPKSNKLKDIFIQNVNSVRFKNVRL